MKTTTNPLPQFNYPSANTRLYDLAADVTILNIRDALNSGFARLTAMLAMTVAEGGEGFRCYSAEVQENYMDGCNLLAKEIHQLYKQLEAMTYNAVTKGAEHEDIAGKHS
jgi:hypothetical protein